MKRALVISSGATKMAFGIGVAEELQKRNLYDLYVGISAGAIISTFAAANKLGVLYGALLNTKMNDVFDISPVTKSGRLSFLAIMRVLIGKLSLSKNAAIKVTIKKLLSSIDYGSIESEVKVGVTNYNLCKIEYPSSRTNSYDDFITWIYASSNIPILTEPVKIANSWYTDGGLLHYFGIQEAIESGANEIDVILHTPISGDIIDEKWEPKNLFEIAKRAFQVMHNVTMIQDLVLADILDDVKNVKINFYYPSEVLEGAVYTLDSKTMKSWHDAGVAAANAPLKIITQ